MGKSMCGHLLDAGYEATVYSRTLSKCDALKAKGAAVVASPKAVAEASDVCFVIVGYPSDVESVVLGPDGVLAGLKPGGIVVDWCVRGRALLSGVLVRRRIGVGLGNK